MSTEGFMKALKALVARPVLTAVALAALGLGSVIGLAATTGADLPWSTSGPSPSPNATETAVPTAAIAGADSFSFVEHAGGAGASSNVRVTNHCGDGRFRARANIALNRISAPVVSPTNLAYAESTGANCITVAVALQVNLYQRGAPRNTPENAAVAINVNCTGCFTYARAIQYVIPTDDPHAAAPDVDALIKDMDRELRFLASMHDPTEAELIAALQRVTAVIDRFSGLAQYLREETRETRSEEPAGASSAPMSTATPAPTQSAPTPSAPSGTPAATASPTASP